MRSLFLMLGIVAGTAHLPAAPAPRIIRGAPSTAGVTRAARQIAASPPSSSAWRRSAAWAAFATSTPNMSLLQARIPNSLIDRDTADNRGSAASRLIGLKAVVAPILDSIVDCQK